MLDELKGGQCGVGAAEKGWWSWGLAGKRRVVQDAAGARSGRTPKTHGPSSFEIIAHD